MATQAPTSTPMTTTTAAVKKAGPPVPPRPSHTTATATAASLLKSQRETATTRITTPIATATSFTNSKVTVANVITEQPQPQQQQQQPHHPVIQKKPTLIGAKAATTAAAAAAAAAGRTVIYKSPSMKPTQQNDVTSLSRSPAHNNAATRDATVASTIVAKSTVTTTRPPLKLRKAPDVPTATKPKASPLKRESIGDSGDSGDKTLDSASIGKTSTPPIDAAGDAQLRNNIVIVQSAANSAASAVNLSRHHSMGSPKTQQSVQLKDTRLSLGRADFEQIQGKIQLDQLPASSQPLPRPRKIVKVPVATLDLEEHNSGANQQPNSSGVSLFRRSKTTLDNFALRANITTISTGGVANTFLGGKTAELKNNLKNAAERLFSEIIVSQQKHAMESPTITKHERAVQHQALPEQERQQQMAGGAGGAVTVVTRSDSMHTCTRININTPIGSNSASVSASASTSAHNSNQHTPIAGHARGAVKIENVLSSPEKKTAFHEILISELAAMRGRFSSMENLSTSVQSSASSTTLMGSSGANSTTTITKSATLATLVQPSGNNQNNSDNNNHNNNDNNANNVNNINNKSSNSSANRENSQLRKRCSSVEDHDPDTEDVDADNVEDTEGDDDVVQKRRKSHNSAGTPRKRCPSGCSSDSSPYGTERSARIRTSDWIEVGDNGKAVTMTSCHISLEDSGLEDEERLDEMSSSGVGDSWDSVKEAENVKRCRSVKRIMSISDLPPLPKSLSGINKMLGSDSGLISDDADANAENQHLQHLNHHHSNSNHNNTNTSASNNNNNNNTLYQKEDSNNNNNKNRNSKNMQNNNKNNENNEIIEMLPSNGSELEANSTAKIIEATTTTTTAAATTIATTTTAAATADIMKTATTTTTATTPTKQSTIAKSNGTANTMLTGVTGSTLDTQLAILRKEMYGLRQLDLSLLSQLWTLNDSIQEFRTMLEEQVQDGDPDSYSPHSPTPSSYDSVSSDGEDDITTTTTINNHGNMNAKKLRAAETTPKIITTQPKLTKSNSVSDNTHRKSVTSSLASSVVSATAMLPPKRPSPPKPLDARPLPRMRSAPPPPPVNRKSAAPPRPT